jgi:Protein of function (DUF2518)
MLTTADFLQYTQWSGIATIFFAVIAILAFFLQWGIRFRLVGTTGFMLVLTAGLFALSIVPFTRVQIPGSVPYSLTYDNGGPFAVIAVKNTIKPEELDATLKQAAGDLYSYGRYNANSNQLLIRARTIIHPQAGVSQLLYIGEVQRSLSVRNDENMQVRIFNDKLALIAKNQA